MLSFFRPQKLWFRSSCAALAALLTFFFTSQEWGEAHAATRAANARAEEWARKLNIDPLRLTDPEAWAAKERKAAEVRRTESMEKLRKHTKADEQEAKAKKARETAEAIRRATPDVDLRREVARARSEGASETTTLARAKKKSAEFARGVAANANRPKRVAPVPSTKRVAPTQLKGGQPRVGKVHGALAPDTRELYARMLDLGVEVLQADGSVRPVEEEYYGVDVAPVMLATNFAHPGAFLPVLGALPAPSADDLAETTETRRSELIVKKVGELGTTPLALYNFVHTQVRAELYYGVKRGAAATLEELAGNDFDQAALLIALLRQAGHPARYEYGTVRLVREQFEALTGATDAKSAAYLLGATGIPAGLGADGQTVLMERAWVRAYVPYGEYRGSGQGGQKLWVRLDPGLKRVKRMYAVDLRGVTTFNFDTYLASVSLETPREIFERQLLAAAKARNLCNTLNDALPTAQPLNDVYRLLPAEHPAKVEASLLLFARPPPEFRWTVELRLDGSAQSFELPELQGRSLALRYPGATDADAQEISAAGGITNVAPYSVRVAPTLRLDGSEVRRFAAVMPGVGQDLTVRVALPGGSAVLAAHALIAGSVYALQVNGGSEPLSRADVHRKRIQTAAGDDRYEEQAKLVGSLYAHRQISDATRLFALQGHGTVMDVVESLTGKELKVEEVGGTPVALAPGNYFVDVARDSLSPVSAQPDAALARQMMRLAGHHGSALEHKVLEEALSNHSVSAVRILQAAASQAVSVFKISPADTSGRSQLAGFSGVTLADIDNALSAGWTVTVPKHPVSYRQYTDLEGYILENPVNGTGAYRINQRLNGGASDGEGGAGGPGECACEARDERTTNSKVNLANGNFRETYADLTLPATGLAVTWTRTYASRGNGRTELGYGWMHSYGMHLRPEPDGAWTYVTEDWTEVRFTPSGSGFKVQPGWYLTLTKTGSGFRITTKHGVNYDFNASGRLVSITEPGQNRTELVYTNGLLTGVKDSDGRMALNFEFTDGLITKVTDRAGRQVSYSYTGDDLVIATDVLGHSETYEYLNHNMVQRVDKRGITWNEFYDAHDRWIGFRDPLGNEASAYFDAVNRRTTYVDRTGAPWTSEFNSSGNPTAKTDPVGNRTIYEWDANSNKTKEIGARGYATTMEYDARGNLTKQTDPDGRVSSYTYSVILSQVLTATSTSMPTRTNTYDAAGHHLTSKYGSGTTTYTYDSRGRPETVTEPGNAITVLNYQADGSLASVTDPEGGITRFAYTNSGQLSGITDPNGHTRTMEVDPANHVTAIVDPLGARTEFSYDVSGNQTTTIEPDGFIRTAIFDGVGRRTETRDPAGIVEGVEYDAEGRTVSTVDARGFRSATAYDGAGRPILKTAADGSSATIAYCADIRDPCAAIDADGNLATIEFDAVGRRIRVIDPLGRASVTQHDTAGRVQFAAGPLQPPTSYMYESTNARLYRTTTPALTIEYGYDARGNRTSVMAASAKTTYVYDKANRLLSETNPLGIATVYTYDSAGNRATKLDGNNRLTYYDYDASRRLRTVRFADATKYEFDYDARGNRTLERNADHERRIEYDSHGRVTRATDSTLGKAITYTYDKEGNRLSRTFNGRSDSYGYEATGRLAHATDVHGNLIALGYDAIGRRTWMARPNGIRTTYAYDAVGQVQNIVHADMGGNVVASFSYEYDAEGRRVSKQTANGSREVYAYDSDHRLTDVSYSATRSIAYTLSSMGARTSTKELFGDGGQNVSRVTSYSYNAFNQLVSMSAAGATTGFSYDRNGNQLTETASLGTKAFSWDADNRLRKVLLADGSSSTYSYDAVGLRVEQATSAGATHYLLDGTSVAAECDELGSTVRSYLHNPTQVDEILSLEENGQTQWPLQDALGSVVAITNSTGFATRTFAYDVYGVRSPTGLEGDLAFGFAGREHDVSGLRYHRDRYADELQGRWVQPDRAGMVDGPNRYQYARADPVSNVDPSGYVVSQTTWLLLLGPLLNGMVQAFAAAVFSALTHQSIGIIAAAAALAFVYGFISSLPFGGVIAGVVASVVASLATGVLMEAITKAAGDCRRDSIRWVAVFVGAFGAIMSQLQMFLLLDAATTPYSAVAYVGAAVASAWVGFIFAAVAEGINQELYAR